MTEEREAAGERQDMMGVLLGKMALEREFITQDQLRDALMEQGGDVEERGAARPLGVILVSKGFLSEPLLLTLLEEQRAASLDPARAKKRDSLLGQVLLQRGEITEQQLNDCIRVQTEAVDVSAEQIPRLGEILVERGYTTARQVTLALAAQKKVMLACEQCGKRFNATGYTPTRRYHCKACNGYLIPLSEYKSTKVDADVSFDASTGTPAEGQPAVPADIGFTPTPGALPAVTDKMPTPKPGVMPAPQPVARIVKVQNPLTPVIWIGGALLVIGAAVYIYIKLFR
jgi:hypothetical protein